MYTAKYTFQKDSYVQELKTRVLWCGLASANEIAMIKAPEGVYLDSRSPMRKVCLEDTILAPDYGGNIRSDRGTINGWTVCETMWTCDGNSYAVHFLQIDHQFAVGESVHVVLNWPRRLQQLQINTTQQLIDDVLRRELDIDMCMWRREDDQSTTMVLNCKRLSSKQVQKVQDSINMLIKRGGPVRTVWKDTPSMEVEVSGLFRCNSPLMHVRDLRDLQSCKLWYNERAVLRFSVGRQVLQTTEGAKALPTEGAKALPTEGAKALPTEAKSDTPQMAEADRLQQIEMALAAMNTWRKEMQAMAISERATRIRESDKRVAELQELQRTETRVDNAVHKVFGIYDDLLKYRDEMQRQMADTDRLMVVERELKKLKDLRVVQDINERMLKDEEHARMEVDRVLLRQVECRVNNEVDKLTGMFDELQKYRDVVKRALVKQARTEKQLADVEAQLEKLKLKAEEHAKIVVDREVLSQAESRVNNEVDKLNGMFYELQKYRDEMKRAVIRQARADKKLMDVEAQLEKLQSEVCDSKAANADNELDLPVEDEMNEKELEQENNPVEKGEKTEGDRLEDDLHQMSANLERVFYDNQDNLHRKSSRSAIDAMDDFLYESIPDDFEVESLDEASGVTHKPIEKTLPLTPKESLELQLKQKREERVQLMSFRTMDGHIQLPLYNPDRSVPIPSSNPWHSTTQQQEPAVTPNMEAYHRLMRSSLSPTRQERLAKGKSDSEESWDETIDMQAYERQQKRSKEHRCSDDGSDECDFELVD